MSWVGKSLLKNASGGAPRFFQTPRHGCLWLSINYFSLLLLYICTCLYIRVKLNWIFLVDICIYCTWTLCLQRKVNLKHVNHLYMTLLRSALFIVFLSYAATLSFAYFLLHFLVFFFSFSGLFKISSNIWYYFWHFLNR